MPVRHGEPEVKGHLALAVCGLAALGLLLAGSAAGQDSSGDVIQLGKGLKVRRLRTGFWVHTSIDVQSVPANGLIARTKEGLLLVDTTWSDDMAERLLGWAEENLADHVVKAIVTHFHPDRTGGLGALQKRGIPVFALDLTRTRLEAQTGKPVPSLLMAATPGAVRSDPSGFEAFYPGAGHTADNLVVWFPHAKILFGGCFVKAEAATDLGNVADADLKSWGAAMKRLQERYPDARVVIPGHGEVGGTETLTHTLELLLKGGP
jgi:metallo-beta-lactamase class B